MGGLYDKDRENQESPVLSGEEMIHRGDYKFDLVFEQDTNCLVIIRYDKRHKKSVGNKTIHFEKDEVIEFILRMAEELGGAERIYG